MAFFIMNKQQPTSPKKRQQLILGALFVLTFIMGWILGHQDAQFSKIGFTPRITNQENQNVDFSIFWRTWEFIEKKYDGNLDYQKMIYGAIRGMVDSLGDPYTAFLSPDEAKQLEDDLSGVVSGIGAEVGIKNKQVTIVAPLENSPAAKAGLKAGDVIKAINGENTEGMDLNVAVSKIRGQAGTKVKLLVRRGTEDKEYEIQRATLTVKSVNSEIKEGNIGYISINRFDEKTTADLRAALESFIGRGVNKVVLDLRNNPGGYLDESVSVSSEFIKSGVIVSEKKDVKDGQKMEYKATGKGKMTNTDYKLVVLINGGSASASEIVAGALQDYKRATLVGEKTFGKGSVQEIEELTGGARLRITVAHWYTPKGKNIGKEGIKPDIEIKLTDEDYNANRDPQLDKALELVK